MRKHSPRKWLHAILDLLPVILIPVFMIYSHRHTLTERTEVDLQYKYQSNEVNSVDDVVVGNIYKLDYFSISDSTLGDFDFYINIYKNDYTLFEDNYSEYNYINKIDIKNCIVQFYIENVESDYFIVNAFIYLSEDDYNNDYAIELTLDGEIEMENVIVSFSSDRDIEQFNEYYNSNHLPLDLTYLKYTDYNIIESVEVQDTNDNIMSVFAKDLSNTVDNYFNMNEVFNLGDVWTWINTNIFSGTAPLIAKTIWNIFVYEFVIDLLFVFYSFFMFLIDFVDNLLEKPFNKGR